MTKHVYQFQSILRNLISGYIEEKRAVGYKFNKGSSLLRQFDNLAANEGCNRQVKFNSFQQIILNSFHQLRFNTLILSPHLIFIR